MTLTVYRASELGGCTRRLTAARLGYTPMEPPESFQAVFARGNDLEAVVKEYLRERDWLILAEQALVRIEVSKNIVLEGHLDGKALKDGRQYVLEVKSMNRQAFDALVERGWYAGGLMDQYKWQVSTYMNATGLELMFVAIDSSDDEGIRTHVMFLEKPFYTELQLRTRVLEIESQQVLQDSCDHPMYPCPFFYLGCGGELPEQADDELTALATACMNVDLEVKILDAKKKELRSKLLSAMGDKTKVRGDEFTLSVVTPSRTEFDRDEAEKKVGDLSAFYTKKEGKPYVRITRREGVVRPRTRDDEVGVVEADGS